MLLASLLSSEVKNQDLLNASLPKDLSEYYKICLTRLSKELNSFDISNEKFQSILNALAVAKEPLPWKMINDFLSLNSSPKSPGVRKIISCLLVSNEEGCVSFFHKSLNDWLLDDRKHDYSVKTSWGHRLVLNFCLKSLDNLKAVGANYDVIKHASVRYSVKYWLLHLLDISDNVYIFENVGKYLVDLEVLVASVLVDRSRTFENFKLFNAHDVYFLISEDIRLLFNEVYSVITFSKFFENEVSFLQCVANDVKDLTSQATTMLQTRFKDSPYLELRDTGFVKARLLRLFENLKSVDVSRNYDYVVCGYEGFVVQLFSLRKNRCLWIKDIAGQFKQYEENAFRVVFHPFKDFIFASQLDKILDINGKISSSPFHCDDSTSKFFTKKRFSKDKYTMVTSYKDTLTVWDVKKGEKKRSIRFNNVISMCFSHSGRYLCVAEKEGVVQILNVANNYETFVYDDHLPSDKLYEDEVLFPVGLHSWFYCGEKKFMVNPTCEKLPDLDPDYNCLFYPLDLFNCDKLRFSKLYEGISGILLNKGNVLHTYCTTDTHLYIIPRACLTNSNCFHKGKFCSNGKFMYRCNEENSRVIIYNLNTFDFVVKECFFSDMVAVENGVILLTEKNIPELWNNDLTKLVYSFDELKGTNKIFEVSDVSFACQKTDSFVFFNVENKRKEISVNFENYRNVHVFACSSKYHVFAKAEINHRIIYCMWHEDKLINGWDDVIECNCIAYAAFSPSADNLLIRDDGFLKRSVKVFDVKNKEFIYNFTWWFFGDNFFFLDDRYIINDGLVLIDLKYFKDAQIPFGRLLFLNLYYCRKRKLAFIFSFSKVPNNCVKIIFPRV
ncbi:uncharacterized protein LOC124451653 [Xenia sp. Carnegie-2017]|uniref:uncharacterized protein LOC124451653 n=1 Tax=Xenia sp. Carnegie-2017 TaxID=2897299 RepID=UPI001F049084|nr:uncharacterized protein LOC124451653 [Xenia sp. Carnegie-2017]XP_046858218.1 uncharacterized protein LOC124451653 [Xenia sp. Carnegie-2017]